VEPDPYRLRQCYYGAAQGSGRTGNNPSNGVDAIKKGVAAHNRDYPVQHCLYTAMVPMMFFYNNDRPEVYKKLIINLI
jgi:hypothetical protein